MSSRYFPHGALVLHPDRHECTDPNMLLQLQQRAEVMDDME